MITHWSKPLEEDDDLAMSNFYECPVCGLQFHMGDIIGLLPVQACGYEGRTILIHKECYQACGDDVK